MNSQIQKALDFAIQYGGIDGAHHKMWVIDQMVRALTNCPMVTESAIDARGQSYEYECQGESEEYSKLIAASCAGEDGPDTYSWDVGIPP